jgi:hypothetical protein
MYKPEFPYKGNQLILSSERLLLHAKSDAIFLFGKQAVSLSSTMTINLDAVDKVLIDCKVIELGAKAQTLGQPVILGRNLNTQLSLLLKEIANAGTLMAQASETDLGASMQLIANAGQIINKEASRLSQVLNSGFILSKNTFTR